MPVPPPGARRQVLLAATFPHSVWVIWDDPRSGSQIDFASFRHAVRTAERGRFDFFLIAETLRLREHAGRLDDLEVAGRPHSPTVMSALAAVTRHIGLVPTMSSTYNEPYELARQIATLDHLSAGRAGWNIVTTADPEAGANFRRGAHLAHADRYARAEEFVRAATALWAGGTSTPQRHRGTHIDLEGTFTLPPGPQGRPVLVQAGDSADGQAFAVRHADIVFSLHDRPADGRRFRTAIRARARALGRDPDSLKVMPGAGFVLGDTARDAAERSREVALRQVTPAVALTRIGQQWGADLSGRDPDDPPPPPAGPPGSPAAAMYARAAAEGLSIRELAIRSLLRHTFVGTPTEVAARIDENVQTGAADGYVLAGHLNPVGFDEFTDRVVPHLQERGVLRTAYPEGATLRENLGLSARQPGAVR
ncbi:LLM class flavin-dependent oxidoreductase [Kitasatospora sp. NBC_00240]|uniref:LLM class flavin-dependent oxidoreductase n=1 Tax=Kitasatospora sp. NBC_00240 TaxID=2903567 RepID=UPI0022574587|nr:LLM class flavin-dependent oxidoreductase [Kitasatospora sp. NBC_00240]MCX5208619.1 LLM class flavin-dependent oxidoreductase [Kitasatospora sp. NBC_00240]